MRLRFTQFLLIAFSVVLFSSCNKYEKILKSNDINLKLTKANEYYDKKKYSRASELYQSVLPMVKGTRNFEPMYYRYAYCFYYMKDYLSSSYHFKNFVEFFPTSRDADECQYMYAVSLYKMSPKPSLEQTNTEKAMEAMQAYINTHPNSKHLAEASGYIDESRHKLEEKDAGAARLYYNIGQFKSATVCYRNMLRNYPDSKRSDLYQYMIVKACYSYAKNSITEKQEERYNNTIAAYNDLKESYPNSSYLRDAETYRDKATNSLNKIKK